MVIDQEAIRKLVSDEKQYNDFSDVDSEEEELPSYPARARSRHIVVVLLFAIVVLIPTTYFVISRWSTSPTRYDQCGTTAAEARTRGCVFETTGFTWLPKECHDPATEDEFLQYLLDNDLKLYRDMNYTDEVSLDEVRRGDGPGFYVRQRYHLTHCLFLIKKLHRGITNGKTLDGQIMPLHHTEHCIGQLLHEPEFRKDDIQFSYTKFPFCGRPGGYNLVWEKQGTWTHY